MASTSKEGSRRANYPILMWGGKVMTKNNNAGLFLVL